MPEARDLPLFRWGAELRRARTARRRLTKRLLAGGLLCGLVLATAAGAPRPRVVWNVSDSMARGPYWVRPDAPLARGDAVVAWLPPAARALAAERHYLPGNVPLVKKVAALEGDLVCAIGEALYINGRHAAARLHHDRRGRPLPWWTGCGRIAEGHYLLLMGEVPASYDGRYFGPVPGRAILGKAVLLWAL
ncbi:S26 family signal peptidase [Allosphingosinicella vermicomposti]|uniref:S26 family signal peptidase n=1 Tax=Allosphingosinicella vermicomposti TaxID=614671 RepID=UPI000D1009A8|nr:S26 family signal peptidase [Allosphingosinicella vermicomposti]